MCRVGVSHAGTAVRTRELGLLARRFGSGPVSRCCAEAKSQLNYAAGLLRGEGAAAGSHDDPAPLSGQRHLPVRPSKKRRDALPHAPAELGDENALTDTMRIFRA